MKYRGFSYVELTIVVLILGIIAAVALPNFASRDTQNLNIAANELVNAIQFARSQSIATGVHHGVSVRETGHGVTVFKADMTTEPVSIGTISKHPLTKQDYDLDLNDWGIDITNTQSVFYYGSGGGYRVKLLFDPQGTPVWHVKSSGTTYQLVSGQINLVHGNHTITVEVAPFTGRVTQS